MKADCSKAHEVLEKWKQENQAKVFDIKMAQRAKEAAKDKETKTKEFSESKDCIQIKFFEELDREGHKLSLKAFMQEMMKESPVMFRAGVKVYETLKKDYQSYSEIHPRIIEEEPPEVTLRNFVESHPCGETDIECLCLINKANHGRVLRSVFNVFLKKNESKQKRDT